MENDKKLEVTKVQHLLRTKTSGAMIMQSDMIFVDGQPAVVLEWLDFSEKATIPAISVPLDPRYLHPMQGWGEVTHLYEMEVVDPRDPPAP
jgi:hypothetical protein|nr:hypothetical protein [Herbaspirillum sp. ASV7]